MNVLITNAIKFSSKGEITIGAKYERGDKL